MHGHINWNAGNLNSGLLLFGKKHIGIFDDEGLSIAIPDNEVLCLVDQGTINYNIQKHRYNIFVMDKKFNGFAQNGFSSQAINPFTKLEGNNKEDAYVMHFIGRKKRYERMYNQLKKMNLI